MARKPSPRTAPAAGDVLRGGPRVVDTAKGYTIEWVVDGKVTKTLKCKTRQEARKEVASVLNPPKKGRSHD